jgi:hypothetical protein
MRLRCSKKAREQGHRCRLRHNNRNRNRNSSSYHSRRKRVEVLLVAEEVAIMVGRRQQQRLRVAKLRYWRGRQQPQRNQPVDLNHRPGEVAKAKAREKATDLRPATFVIHNSRCSDVALSKFSIPMSTSWSLKRFRFRCPCALLLISSPLILINYVMPIAAC